MVALNYYCDYYACCDCLYCYVDVVDTSCPSKVQFHQYTHQYYLQIDSTNQRSLQSKHNNTNNEQLTENVIGIEHFKGKRRVSRPQ